MAERFFFQGRRFLAGLLLAPTVFGAWQAEAQVAVSNETMNFETGRVTWNWACADHARLRYRYDTTGSYSIWTIDVGLGTDLTTNLITNRDYVEANIQLSPDSGCGTNIINGTTISYTATTLSSSPASLSDTNLNTATLTVTLGDDEAERTGATSPRTWASGAAASHFSLATEAITGLSISGVTGITTGGSTATVTLAFSGEVSAAATVAVQVAAAAHSGANTITSRSVSVAASPGFSVSEGSLLLDEAPGAVNAHRGGYEVRINTQPASSCASGVVLTIASDNADITASPSTLTFTNSNYAGPRRVTVFAAKDSDSSTDSATLSHTVTTACTPDYPASMAVNSVSVTARDDDRRLVVTPAELALEEGSTGSYTVALGGSPAAGATVTVTATSANPAVRVDSDGTPTTRVLNFTSANWNTAQTVTVTATSDGDAADEFSTIANAAAEAIWQPFDVTVRVADDEETGTDYDTDDDGLIEIATLAQLNAVRWDLDGDGAVDSSTNATSYGNAFPNAAADMGCPDGPDDDQTADCVGYELAAKLDFDTDGDGDVDGNDPGSYANWSPIGGTYSGVFDGNGRTISKLTVSTTGKAGLFNTLTGTVRRLGLVDANVRTTGAQNAGALVADVTNPGQIVACWSSGAVTGTAGTSNVYVGGLVGLMADSDSKLAASFSTAAVSGTNNGGGLMGGIQEYATVIASYSTGTVGAARVGGLVGSALQGLRGNTTLRASYAIGRPTGGGSTPRVGGLVGSITGNVRSIDMYFDSQTTARTTGAGRGTSGTAQTTSQLQTPTSATGIYANWDELDIDGDGAAVEDPWDFGSSTQYPALSYGGLDAALQFNSQGTNSAPSFGSGSVSNQTYRQSQPISLLQAPAATGGNGILTYTAYGLPDGLSIDSDGSGACGQARTICGSPTTVGSSTVRIVVTDQDDTDASDRDALTFTVDVANPSAAITATNPTTLVESSLNNATVTVTLTNTTFVSGVTKSSFMLDTAVPGLTVASMATVSSGDTAATLTLGYDGSNFDAQLSLGVTVTAAAHAFPGDLATASVDVFPNRGVTLSASTLLVPEDDSANYTVRLASIPSGGNVTVAITGAGSGISVNLASLTFTPSNWNTARTVRVSAIDDPNPTHEMVTLTHTPTGGGYTGLTAPTLQVTATDRDAPSLLVTPTQLRVDENDDQTYTIRLNTQPTGDVTVTVSGASGAATVDTDAASGNQNTLTFTQTTWSANQTVTVAAGDDDNAMSETLTLSHTASGGGYGSLPSGSRPSVQVTVDDDDMPAILIDADPNTANDQPGPLALNEMSGHADNTKDYTVRLATEPTAQVEVSVTSGDRAVSVHNDATPRTRTLTFSTTDWATAQTVTATAAEDDDHADERVSISHSASGGDYSDLSAELVATTVDDDEPAIVLVGAPTAIEEGTTEMYEVHLDTEPTGTVRVQATASGDVEVDMDPAQAGRQPWLRFDGTNWNTPRTVAARALHDDDAENEMGTIRHVASGADYGLAPAAEIAFAVNEDDEPGVWVVYNQTMLYEGSSWEYQMYLATVPIGGPVQLSATSSDEAVATVSPSALTFSASDWNVPKRVRVQGIDGGSATITHVASGADYDGVPDPTVPVTVLDTDTPGVRVEPLSSTLFEGESGSYRIRLNTQPSGNVLVTPSAGAFAPKLDVDDDGVALTFTTTDWDQERTVSFEAQHDDDAQHEFVTVTHSVSGYAGVSSAPSLVVFVGDDETAGLRFEPAGGTALREGGAPGAYTVVLASQPTAAATVTLSSDDAGLAFDADDGVPGDQDSLTFDASNWATARTVAVRAVLDADAATDEATLLHTVSGGGPHYDDLTAEYPVRVSDADAALAPSRVSAAAAGATSLAVSWSASPGARGYWVQWRQVGDEWSVDRLIEVPAVGAAAAGVGGALQVATGALSARIDGLRTGVVYEVRVLALNGGDPGDPSATARATPASGAGSAGGNRAPEVVATPEIVLLPVGGETELDLSGMFREPDGDALTYSAASTDQEVASATVAGSALRIFGGRPGNAQIEVTAEDPQGLSARLDVRVGVIGTACSTAPAQAPEGGTAVVVAELASAVQSSTTVRWRIVRDANPATADADAGDHGDASGEVTIRAGERCAEIEIPILDDAVAEPAREWFTVEMWLRYNRDARLERATAPVAVLEGVCDRAPAVRRALQAATGARRCEEPAPADLRRVRMLDLAGARLGALATEDLGGLSALRTLDLSGNGLSGLPALPEATRLEHLLLAGNALQAVPLGALPAPERLRGLVLSNNALADLPADAFAAAPGLRSLRLDGNRLRTLPEGLFAGLGSLRMARLDGNPGAPFALPVRLQRVGAEMWAPPPATLRAAMPLGAPFETALGLSAEGGVFADGAAESGTVVPAGETASEPFVVDSATGFARVSLAVPELPARRCTSGPCWQGLALQAGEPLALFARPPRVFAAPAPEALFGEGLRVKLSALAVAGEPGGELQWRVRSSDPTVATARVLGGHLLVEPEPGVEGTVQVEATAIDGNGQMATVRFEVRVEFHWPAAPTRGWRGVILDGQR